MFIGRLPDGSIYGAWSIRQNDDADHLGQEELPDDHPEVISFAARPVPYKPPADERLAALLVEKGLITKEEIEDVLK